MKKVKQPDIDTSTMLVVDDNDIFRETLRKFLESEFKSSRILEAGNGSDAVRLVQENIPDLIVLDINMPEMSGFEVANQVKQGFPFVPIVMLSNYEEIEYRIAAKKCLVDAFITKKNLVSELPAVIRELVASKFCNHQISTP
jgi:two-component system response regulator DegU